MNKNAIKLLEYDKIIDILTTYAVSDKAKDMIRKLEPSLDINVIETWLEETTQSRAIINKTSNIPLCSMKGYDNVMGRLAIGAVLAPEELCIILGLLEECSRLKRFMANVSNLAPIVSSYAQSLYELNNIIEEIDQCIRNGKVDDKASNELLKIRKKIFIHEDRIKSKLDSILKSPSYKNAIQDSLISQRGGRYVIPIKNEYRRNFEGSVLDSSASGSTVFIEPAEVRKLQDELNILKAEEEREVYRILSTLTALVYSYTREISINAEIMVNYDFLFAKAKYSKSIDGNTVFMNTNNQIKIISGKHPLIGKSAVPLDFTIGNGYRALIITGPNTGGKTVALKTVGLFTLMAQSGLHIPVETGSEMCIFSDVLVDIGDGQSIEQSLSTFSSHIKNIIEIVNASNNSTLVIMDEIGAGTDPGEGMGLAISILETIFQRGATMIVTSHFSEIKDFGNDRPGFMNGCMEFDINTLKPQYRLSIGRSGESNAFLIALRLGMDKSIIERAHEVTYKERKEYCDFLQKLNDVPQTTPSMHTQDKIIQIEHPDSPSIVRRHEKQKPLPSFKVGDCVFISSIGRTGIVCEAENNRGELEVMVMKKKIKVNKKRLSIYIENSELYPENYDFDIVFESKENRKKKHQMEKRHVEGMVIERPGN